jgi:Flp pilus assembly protein CpaB
MRAVAIDSRSADFEGLLRPGDRVDVLFTAEGKDEGSTVTLLQNVLVLSVGGNTVRAEDEGSGRKTIVRGGSVTVSATVEQAQLVTQAQQRGRLTLTLRNSDDITIVEGVPEATGRDLRVEAAVVDTSRRAARPPRDTIQHVR